MGLPVLLDGVSPCVEYLPDFCLELARDVEWEEERMCYKGVAQVGVLVGGWRSVEGRCADLVGGLRGWSGVPLAC